MEHTAGSKNELSNYLADLAVNDPDMVMQLVWEMFRKALVLMVMREVEAQIARHLPSEFVGQDSSQSGMLPVGIFKRSLKTLSHL